MGKKMLVRTKSRFSSYRCDAEIRGKLRINGCREGGGRDKKMRQREWDRDRERKGGGGDGGIWMEENSRNI